MKGYISFKVEKLLSLKIKSITFNSINTNRHKQLVNKYKRKKNIKGIGILGKTTKKNLLDTIDIMKNNINNYQIWDDKNKQLFKIY